MDFCRPVPPGHGFRLADGNYQTIDGPGASLTVPYRSNDRGQLVGVYENTAAAPTMGRPAPTQGSGREPTGNGSARSRSSML